MTERVPETDVLQPTARGPVQLKLAVVDGVDFGREFRLERGTYRLGKDPACEICLRDSAVSRVHLTLSVRTTGIEIKDQGSTNGSICNGARFETLIAHEGAVIEVGRTQLKLAPLTQNLPKLPPSSADHFGTLWGQSLAMRQVFAVLERVAASDSDVLIHGETGTGKELTARSIHQNSPRKDGPFVVCDLSTTQISLAESELFGHVRGAFTGALADRVGVFQMADGGTLFLDEVGETAPEVQAALLRALERREVKRLGDNTYRKVDVRMIAATHQDLEKGITEGTFRRDLFHRLARAEVSIPPLRERVEDIPFLIDRMLQELGKHTTLLDAQTRALLGEHPWPGNVRELRNVVERVVTLGAQAAIESPDSGGDVGESGANVPFKKAKERLIDAFERKYLRELLDRCRWNLSQAAREAGIDRFYIRQLVKKHGLQRE